MKNTKLILQKIFVRQKKMSLLANLFKTKEGGTGLFQRMFKSNKGASEESSKLLSQRLLKLFVIAFALGTGIAGTYFSFKYCPVPEIKEALQKHLKDLRIFQHTIKNYRNSGKDLIPTVVIVESLNGLVESANESLKNANDNSTRRIRIIISLLYAVITLILGIAGIRISRSLLREILQILKNGKITEEQLKLLLVNARFSNGKNQKLPDGIVMDSKFAHLADV